MTELEKILEEVKEVYLEEKAEGNIEGWRDKQRFIQESVNLYIEKINMHRYDRELIVEQLLREQETDNYRVYVDDRLISLREILDRLIEDELEIRIREVINNGKN